MYTITDIANHLNITVRATRALYATLKPLLGKHVKHGPKNSLLFDDYSHALFERLIALKAQRSLSTAEAVEEIRGEIQEPHDQDESAPPPPNPDLIAAKDALIAHLTQENAKLNQRLDDMQRIVDTLTPLALPKPRRTLRNIFHRS